MQEKTIRAHFAQLYWLTVGADAVGVKTGQLQGQLYKQLAGKSLKGEDDHERQGLLVQAMADKRRALVVSI